MPIKIPNGLPARSVLESENIFVMPEDRALSQDIRPLRILLVNLMPTKVETETQLLRLLSNTPLQVEIELMHMASHQSKNTPPEYLLAFYKTFEEIKDQRFDGMIITGAPVELLDFEEVTYWDELCSVFNWSVKNVFSTFHICWGAQAALYHHYGIPKYPLEQKTFGVFRHKTVNHSHLLLKGFDDDFWAPHSRHTGTRIEDILANDRLELLSYSEKAGPYIASDKTGRQIFVFGHSEYDVDTLAKEYFRDVEKGLDTQIPEYYFLKNDPANPPFMSWRSHAYLLYSNWLNYFVYQNTPFDLNQL
jgi:homoserine O-succinyltransferase